jgi:hypothetical protein
MRLAPYAGAPRRSAPRYDLSRARTESAMARFRLQRYKDLARSHPPTPATGGFPYPGRTQAEVERRGLPNGRP